MRFTFKREEKLKSRKLIEKLFEKGDSITEFPLRMIFLKIEHNSNFKVQASFSVSKRKFKKAVDRNRIKRLMRECYRTNKHTIYQNIKEKHIIMFTYLDEKEYKYVELEEKMINLIRKFIQKTKKE